MKHSKFSLLIVLLLLLGTMLPTGCTPKKFVVGIVNPSKLMEPVVEGFKARMAELGYVEGENITYIYKGVVTKEELDATVQDLLTAQVDLILSVTTPATVAAQKATADAQTPVVFVPVTDPIDAGLVANLANPGGNLTGIATGGSDEKRLYWLLQIAPNVKRIYYPYNPNDKSPVTALALLQAAARKLNVELIPQEMGSVAEIQAAIAALPTDIDAIFIGPDALVGGQFAAWIEAATARQLPLSGSSASHVEAGMLMSYSYDTTAAGQQAARLVDEIFKGAAPATVPVEFSEFFLSINLKTAEAISLEIPESILQQAKIYR